MIELGEAEKDQARRHRGRGGAQEAQGGGRAARARGAALGRGRRQRQPISKCMPARAAPRARTGPACCCACTCAGPSSTATRSDMLEESAGRGRRHQVGDHPGQGPQRLWLAEDRGRRASPGAHLAVRFQRAAAYVVRQRRGVSGDRRPHQDRDRREPTCASTPCGRGGAGGQHVNKTEFRGAPHAHPDRHRGGVPAGALAAQEPRPGLGHAARAGSTRSN